MYGFCSLFLQPIIFQVNKNTQNRCFGSISKEASVDHPSVWGEGPGGMVASPGRTQRGRLRVSWSQASALREAEVERRRLLTELKWLQESRDKARSVYPPRKLTWNLKLMVSNRNLLFQGFIFRFHVSFPGCSGCEETAKKNLQKKRGNTKIMGRFLER